MKRFLSWVVLAVCSYLALILCGVVSNVVMSLVNLILNSKTALIIWILLGGGGGFVGVSVAFALLAGVVMSLSESVCASGKGTRYKVAGGIIMAVYAFMVIGLLAGFVRAALFVPGLVSNILYFYFGLMLLLVSHSDKRIIWKK